MSIALGRILLFFIDCSEKLELLQENLICFSLADIGLFMHSVCLHDTIGIWMNWRPLYTFHIHTDIILFIKLIGLLGFFSISFPSSHINSLHFLYIKFIEFFHVFGTQKQYISRFRNMKVSTEICIMDIPKKSVLQEIKEKYPKDGTTCNTYKEPFSSLRF